ncbi:uncharacterized protein L3040_002569 [Drepanopeziza brunnea f. sp. 'multigermtubi']|uniref:MEI5 protein n=1 Tax=Marssonina brunnea f. sp. multigermtubi (strain MB_m1) TaxID=1072389 RepID=K1X3F3_MARBU|nr:uncharacterized protein MBM_02789 [Drepanopeziza brunnea f. sp. 'multigermtubi' MB_m1]EKD19552.1 hypothetical protein MBM_02789 [Drepanopeziza brunnea f. sp. 'multigermtubi' MB_m1]KAJ5050694.1 hypothetical protein L3040_002569 [Drepanopeziza brunnea f. sp. 'multigermtubi']
MPKHRNQRLDADQEGDESTTGSGNGNDSNRNRNQKNGRAEPHYDEVRSNGGTSMATSQAPNVSLATTTTKNTIRQMRDLVSLYELNVQAIEEAETNRQKIVTLELLCQSKDAELRKHKITVETLGAFNDEKDARLREERDHVKREREVIEMEREKLERAKQNEKKRKEMNEAIQAAELEKERKKLAADQEKSFKSLREGLEQQCLQKVNSSKKELSDLESKNKELRAALQTQHTQIQKCEEQLKLTRTRCEDSELAKEALKKREHMLKAELDGRKVEFGLTTKSPEFFREKFADLANQVKSVSEQFCLDLVQREQEWKPIHDKLTELDACFASVPISESDDSKMLRTAHVRRLISSKLHKIILQPFSSDMNSQGDNKASVELLRKIMVSLSECGPGTGRHAATVFRTLAIHGLQCKRADHTGTSDHPPRLYAARAEAFIQSVMPVLSLLTPGTQQPALKDALVSLAESAISVWELAQTDENLDITVSLDLNPSLEAKWRSSEFDAGATPDAWVPSTLRRIFTLFPTVLAKTASAAEDPAMSIPGGFEQSGPEMVWQEICIHDGIGLAESSALVWRGKEEQEQREEDEVQERLKREIEDKRRELDVRGKAKSQKTGSVSVSVSGPSSSPSSSWSMAGGNRTSPEE